MEGLPHSEIIKIFLGIILLVIGGELLISGGIRLARRYKISNLFIGLTVVAFGNSAPELFVSLSAALTGHPVMATGNIIGSNLANIGLVIAVIAIAVPLPVASTTIKRSLPILLFSGILLFTCMFDGVISHSEGFLMISILLLGVIASHFLSKKELKGNDEQIAPKKFPFGLTMTMILVAALGLGLGSNLLIEGAAKLSSNFAINERLVALTIVAISTSIPELVVTLVAFRRKEAGIAVGNLIGSTIYNVFAVIGITASIQVIRFDFNEFRIDLIAMLLIYVVLFILIVPFNYLLKSDLDPKSNFALRWKKMKDGKITRIAGTILLILYVCYLFIILKNNWFD